MKKNHYTNNYHTVNGMCMLPDESPLDMDVE